jgi:hypothetical protein
MEQVRFLLYEKNHQESIYLGKASTINEARQIHIDNFEYGELTDKGFYIFGNKRIS